MDIELDANTLISVYQAKVGALMQENILLEAKNIILTNKLAEALNNPPEVKSTARKKSVNTGKAGDTF